jgi:repressor LexA
MVDLSLTKRQREIFDFIKSYSARHGYPPTVRDIGKAIGLTSSSTVHAHLANLEKLGLLRRDPTKPRALELLGEAARKVVPGPSGLPLVGRVAAGAPILAEENIEDHVVLSSEIAKDGYFLLRVRGDSMINAGILNDDLVLVRPQQEAANGSIVVALVDGDATVKRFERADGHVKLIAENPAYEPIVTSNVSLVGQVRGVIRLFH